MNSIPTRCRAVFDLSALTALLVSITPRPGQSQGRAARVFFVTFEMFCKVNNAVGQNSHLDFGRTRVARLSGILINQFLFFLSCNRHMSTPINIIN